MYRGKKESQKQAIQSENIARIAKAASNKLPGKSSLNVSFVLSCLVLSYFLSMFLYLNIYNTNNLYVDIVQSNMIYVKQTVCVVADAASIVANFFSISVF